MRSGFSSMRRSSCGYADDELVTHYLQSKDQIILSISKWISEPVGIPLALPSTKPCYLSGWCRVGAMSFKRCKDLVYESMDKLRSP